MSRKRRRESSYRLSAKVKAVVPGLAPGTPWIFSKSMDARNKSAHDDYGFDGLRNLKADG
jgi:hypothetical protein